MAVSQEPIYIYRNLDSTPLRVDKMQTFVYMDLRCTNRSCLFNGLLKYSFDDPEAALNECWQYDSIAHLAPARLICTLSLDRCYKAVAELLEARQDHVIALLRDCLLDLLVYLCSTDSVLDAVTDIRPFTHINQSSRKHKKVYQSAIAARVQAVCRPS